jgi:ectoine hydroxylase-related dioxygenase (phytanoyl-CoA dioxygenase family)
MLGIAEKHVQKNLVEEFDRNGAVCVRGAFDSAWIAELRKGFQRVQENPSPRAHEFIRNADGKVFRSDPDNWERIPEYRDFVYNSPCSQIAAELMQSAKANLFFDQSFYRSPGQQFRTPWHQDEPYWSIDGFQTMGIWMPLVPVEKKSSLEFIRGSHRWEEKYKQIDFDDVSPEGLAALAGFRCRSRAMGHHLLGDGAGRLRGLQRAHLSRRQRPADRGPGPLGLQHEMGRR